MIYTELTKKAMKICFECHKDQYDKSGMPYVFHPFHLAEQMADELSTVCALLHDVIEDTEISFEDLKNLGFNDEIISVLKLLTHDDVVDYFEYVTKIKSNETARKVKIADLNHNSDINRLNEIKEEDYIRINKYKKAIDILNE